MVDHQLIICDFPGRNTTLENDQLNQWLMEADIDIKRPREYTPKFSIDLVQLYVLRPNSCRTIPRHCYLTFMSWSGSIPVQTYQRSPSRPFDDCRHLNKNESFYTFELWRGSTADDPESLTTCLRRPILQDSEEWLPWRRTDIGLGSGTNRQERAVVVEVSAAVIDEVLMKLESRQIEKSARRQEDLTTPKVESAAEELVTAELSIMVEELL